MTQTDTHMTYRQKHTCDITYRKKHMTYRKSHTHLYYLKTETQYDTDRHDMTYRHNMTRQNKELQNYYLF